VKVGILIFLLFQNSEENTTTNCIATGGFDFNKNFFHYFIYLLVFSSSDMGVVTQVPQADQFRQ
jgi:hypothetical protein